MKKLVLPLLLVAPLAAQSFELGLNVSRQTYQSRDTVPKVEAEDKTVVAARAGYSLIDFGPALFQVTAAYQPKAETELKPNGFLVPTKLGNEYWAVGAMFNFKALVAFGAGVDYRFETRTITNVYSSSHTYSRPWARVNAGYAFPTPIVKPFIGLEVAVPLTDEELGPKLQIGVYGGIRF
ncbi:hypothetical protein [Geothrix oryzisoli]|uniref:hypothetical protein n=1 Tax=Geothrix oryzisoli TaxID=2922721 RepID=UPI001FABCC82|nr:hypothetical protein [Geothrix oryzisoli]